MAVVKQLTCNSGGVGVLVGSLHVLHEGFSAEEHLVAHGAAGSVGSAEQGRVLLQYRITQL